MAPTYFKQSAVQLPGTHRCVDGEYCVDIKVSKLFEFTVEGCEGGWSVEILKRRAQHVRLHGRS